MASPRATPASAEDLTLVGQGNISAAFRTDVVQATYSWPLKEKFKKFEDVLPAAGVRGAELKEIVQQFKQALYDSDQVEKINTILKDMPAIGKPPTSEDKEKSRSFVNKMKEDMATLAQQGQELLDAKHAEMKRLDTHWKAQLPYEKKVFLGSDEKQAKKLETRISEIAQAVATEKGKSTPIPKHMEGIWLKTVSKIAHSKSTYYHPDGDPRIKTDKSFEQAHREQKELVDLFKCTLMMRPTYEKTKLIGGISKDKDTLLTNCEHTIQRLLLDYPEKKSCADVLRGMAEEFKKSAASISKTGDLKGIFERAATKYESMATHAEQEEHLAREAKEEVSVGHHVTIHRKK